ncbi:WSC domain-containing protein 2 [Nannizzia gypsea CBS 118893]|uniref:WSC domain-containing protein 2 n=1 Tax=Arthroderma gypseum (strain ATCC MYA-4604 / CBS 118893) TaxID=535722 RepID=E4V740_ARTGP|nr:WSC domain-containing protein 2 [Nannizzia gypsea CBS 118893]EFQ96906.1 WSC domain-containing protein 2 [Nannizzia gypsea CBS 118893]
MLMNQPVVWAAFALSGALALPTWPSAVDELEDLMFLNTGYHARGFSAGVTPCSFSKQGPSRIASAEWVRTAFHDMATGNVFTGVGGLDASIVFELGGRGGENIGAGFNTTLETFTPFFSTRSSMADLIALGVRTAVRSCGGPVIQVKAGRVDATARGPIGVPVPENSQGTFINQFTRTGFDIADMIAVTACGHTMGGVHASNFPQIVIPGSAPEDFQLFDSTAAFDEKVAVDFVGGVTGNPLTSSTAKRNQRDSDTKVFTADQNVTIKALADQATFRTTCARVLQKMIEVVPAGVNLTEPLEPYEVKPSGLQLYLAGNGSTISFTGEIRVRTTVRPATSIAKVELVYKDRMGGSSCGSCVISTEYKGAAEGFDDSFAFYGFDASLPVESSISQFNVRIVLTTGETVIYDNNASGYPVQDTIMLQPKQSCVVGGNAPGNLVVVAAVRDSANSPEVKLAVTTKTPRSCCVTPALTTQSVPMLSQTTVGPYTLYSGNFTLAAAYRSSAKFDVSLSSGGAVVSDSFKNTADLGSMCVPFGSNGTTMPDYTFDGCYTDTPESRALTGAAFVDGNMTVAACSGLCKGYQFFGLEYGTECYCGNSRSSSSMQAPESECNQPCGGDSSETCGAGYRIGIYKDKTWIPTTNPQIPGYNYTGCYSDSPSNRTLSGSLTYNEKMTVELCAAFCNGTKYFGIEYFSECYCGADLFPESTMQPESDCGFFCSGNKTQHCGGNNRINIYTKIDT